MELGDVATSKSGLDPNDFATPDRIAKAINILLTRYSDMDQFTEEGLISYVYFGIRKAILSYDEDKGFALESWIITKAVYYTIDQLRAEGQLYRRDRSSSSRRRFVYVGDMMSERMESAKNRLSDERLAELTLPIYNHDGFKLVDNEDACEFLMSKLNKRQKKIFDLKFYGHLATTEIGLALKPKISRGRVSQIFSECADKLEVYRDEAGYEEPQTTDSFLYRSTYGARRVIIHDPWIPKPEPIEVVSDEVIAEAESVA